MSLREIYNAEDVFTPTKPARFTFVEREAVNDKLVAALKTPGKQIVVYGHSGSGKTTLLVNKLHQIYEDHITTRCISGLTFDQLLLDAFDRLGNFFDSERLNTKRKTISSAVEAEYLGIKAKFGRSSGSDDATKQQRVLPPQLTPQTLAGLLGEAHCCWVLEDFHKIEPEEKKKLAQVMKVFMDMADQYNDLKIIAIGAVDTARQVIEYDAEMRNRVSELYVPLMTDDEVRLILNKGEALLNVSFRDEIKDDIVKYSNGLASVCHQLALNMCHAANILMTESATKLLGRTLFKKAIEQYLEDSSDTLKGAFDKAFRQLRKTRFSDAKLIVEAFLQVDQEGAVRTVLHDKIKLRHEDYPSRNLSNGLEQLQKDERGKIIRYDTSSGRYSFTDPFYRAFALALMEKDKAADAGDVIWVTTGFESKLANWFSERLVFDAKWVTIASPAVPQATERKKQLPKMDWSNPVFSRRGHRRHSKHK